MSDIRIAKKPINPLKYEADEHGLKEFYWPYTRKEVIAFEEELSKTYCTLIPKHTFSKEEENIFKILQKYFVGEAVGIFQSELLRQRSKKDGVNFTFTTEDQVNYPLWYAALENNYDYESKHLAAIMNGPRHVPFIKKMLRPSNIIKAFKTLKFKKGKINIDGISLKITDQRKSNEHVFVTQRLPLINKHASEVQSNLVYSRSEKYFSKVISSDISKVKEHFFVAELINFYKLTCLNFGCDPSQESLNYLESTTQKIFAGLSIHYSRLQKVVNLPKTLWIGTGGYVWDALLACIVRERGGYVSGHDHGSGLAHVDMGFAGFIDLWLCDEYYTFCKGQAEELTKAVPEWGYMGSQRPKITYPQNTRNKLGEVNFIKPSTTRSPKTVYLIATIYDRDRGRHCPLMPDITQIDWQIRLVSHLKKWGYEVVIKLHPESPFLPPDALSRLGAKVTQERFEDVMNKADLFIFDNIYTSVFRCALATEMPIMIIDFEEIPWTCKAKKLIEERCCLLREGFDKKNRVTADWEDLKSKINKVFCKKINHGYQIQYYADEILKSQN